MRPILATSIASLCVLTRPQPAYGADDPPKVDTPTTQLGLDDRVAGEEPPDFTGLDGEGGESSQDDRVAQEPPPGVTPTQPEPKGTPPALKAADPNDELEVPPVEPVRETKEQPIPDPKEHAAAAKKASEEEAARATEPEKVAAKPAETTPAPVEVKLPTDEEVDAMQPRPGAPAAIVKDFKTLKETVLKPALAEARRLKAELEARAAAPAMTPEIEAKLKQADEDRQWREAFDLENDPKLQAEITAKVTAADDKLFKFLKETPRIQLSDEALGDLKDIGLDSPDGHVARNKLLKAVKGLDDELLLDQVKDAFRERDGVIKEKETKLQELRGKQGDLTTAKAKQEETERIAWAEECNKNIIKGIEAIEDNELFLTLPIPAEATPEEKKRIEAHNESLNKVVVPKFLEGIRAIHQRDPQKTTQFLLDSIRLPKIEASLKENLEKLKKAESRIAELESDGGKMRRVAAPSRIDTAPAPTQGKAETPATNFDLSAEDAIDQYRREKGLHPGNAR